MTSAEIGMETQEQLYVFAAHDPFGEASSWAWCEMWTRRGHFTVPTPFASVDDALAEIAARNPEAYVDTIEDASEIRDALRFTS